MEIAEYFRLVLSLNLIQVIYKYEAAADHFGCACNQFTVTRQSAF